jgi:hypothetical protein
MSALQTSAQKIYITYQNFKNWETKNGRDGRSLMWRKQETHCDGTKSRKILSVCKVQELIVTSTSRSKYATFFVVSRFSNNFRILIRRFFLVVPNLL